MAQPPVAGAVLDHDHPKGPRRVRRSLAGPHAAMVAILVVGACLVAGSLIWRGPTGNPGVTWPAAIAPIAGFVSHDRGLAFLHSVPVHLQTPTVFDAAVAKQDQPTSAATRAYDRRYAAELRALGLLDGSVNLVAVETASDDEGGVLGYYTPTSKALYVRGRTLTPAVRVTIAHELTHALQDQHFGLNRLGDRAVTQGEQFALTSLEEGDAVLDEDDYQDSLPPAQQREATEETAAGSPGAATNVASTTVPVLTVTASVPYVLGPDLVEALYAVGGNAAIDAAFEHPPTTELDILDPTAYLGKVPARSLRPPILGPGERREGPPEDFGAFMLYLTLAAQIPARTALAAADGWAGGTMVQYRPTSGTAASSCLRVDLVGRSSADTARITTALGRWAEGMPTGLASSEPGPDQEVELSACDPRRAARAGPGTLEAALTLANQRDQNQVNALYGGASAAEAACVGNDALGDPTLLRAEGVQGRTYGTPPASATKTVNQQTSRLIRRCSS